MKNIKKNIKEMLWNNDFKVSLKADNSKEKKVRTTGRFWLSHADIPYIIITFHIKNDNNFLYFFLNNTQKLQSMITIN